MKLSMLLAPQQLRKHLFLAVFAYLFMVTAILMTAALPFKSTVALGSGFLSHPVAPSTQAVEVEFPEVRAYTVPYQIIEWPNQYLCAPELPRYGRIERLEANDSIIWTGGSVRHGDCHRLHGDDDGEQYGIEKEVRP